MIRRGSDNKKNEEEVLDSKSRAKSTSLGNLNGGDVVTMELREINFASSGGIPPGDFYRAL